ASDAPDIAPMSAAGSNTRVASREPAAAGDGHDTAPSIGSTQPSHSTVVPSTGGSTALPRAETGGWVAPPPEGRTGTLPEADTRDRLIQSLRMQFLRGGGDAVLQLRPEH